MSTTVDLTRARIIELTDPLGWECLLRRLHPSDSYFNGIGSSGTGAWLMRNSVQWILDRCTNIRVLAEFELTLADLLPEGCEAFRFTVKGWGLTSIAVYDVDFKTWEVTGYEGDFASLADLQRELDVDLNSVVPLELRAHPEHEIGNPL